VTRKLESCKDNVMTGRDRDDDEVGDLQWRCVASQTMTRRVIFHLLQCTGRIAS
jgi:hypothetical protein